MAKSNSTSGIQAVKVEDYPERPLKDALAKDDEPRVQVDQIEDYHKTHPTLDTSGPEHDPEVQAKVLAKVEEKTPDPQDPPKA